MFISSLKLKENPKINSNLLSRLSFHYLNPLFALGSSRPLVEEDLWEPTPNNRATVVCERTEKAWKEQLSKQSPSQGSPVFDTLTLSYRYEKTVLIP